MPTPSVINKKYRSGTLLGKIARHLSGHKNTKKFFAANLSALAIVGTLLPGAQGSVQAAAFNTQPDETIIQTQNTLKTEKSIQYPLETVKVNQGFGIFHLGIDFGAEIGDSIKSIKAGIVTEAGYATDGYGKLELPATQLAHIYILRFIKTEFPLIHYPSWPNSYLFSKLRQRYQLATVLHGFQCFSVNFARFSPSSFLPTIF